MQIMMRVKTRVNNLVSEMSSLAFLERMLIRACQEELDELVLSL